jgi:hypothetical protein
LCMEFFEPMLFSKLEGCTHDITLPDITPALKMP